MRFGMKAFLCNVVVVLLAFGISGYFIIDNNYQVALNRELESVVEENQMLRTILEGEITKMILRDQYLGLESIGDLKGMRNNSLENIQTSLLVLSEQRESLYRRGDVNLEKEELLDNLAQGEKNYVIEKTNGVYRLTAASMLGIDDEQVYICNIKDITYIYENIEYQMRFYQAAMSVAAVLCSLFMLIISLILTRPVKKLNRAAGLIARGNYDMRTQINSQDEIGELGSKFDLMARAVEVHVDELKEEARKRDEFVADFTHELKTPLTAVIGYADMLRSKKMPEENRIMAADYIFREGMRLEKMSGKLFDLLLLDKYVMKRSKIYLSTVTEAAVSSVRPQYERDGIHLCIETEDMFLCGDKELLGSVLINLLDNARKASEEGSVVMLAAQKRNDKCLLSVTDSGRGIPEEELKKITRAFYMVDKSRSRKRGGAGLGLALAAKVIELHQGEMDFASKPGAGTTVWLTIPLAEEKQEAASDEE